MAKKFIYPAWKKAVWRFLRVFIAAFLTTLVLSLKDIENLDNIWMIALYPAIIAGISALAKFAREQIASGDYTKAIHKLPL